jgi:hypothetical protein
MGGMDSPFHESEVGLELFRTLIDPEVHIAPSQEEMGDRRTRRSAQLPRT